MVETNRSKKGNANKWGKTPNQNTTQKGNKRMQLNLDLPNHKKDICRVTVHDLPFTYPLSAHQRREPFLRKWQSISFRSFSKTIGIGKETKICRNIGISNGIKTSDPRTVFLLHPQIPTLVPGNDPSPHTLSHSHFSPSTAAT